MTQMLPIFDDPLPDRALAAAALGLSEDEIDARLPVQVVSCGVPFVLRAGDDAAGRGQCGAEPSGLR